MKIKVLFLAQIKEIFGESERWMEVPEGCCVGDVAKQILRGVYPERSRGAQDDGNFMPVVFAVNENFETAEKKLMRGDTLAIMTPVSGG